MNHVWVSYRKFSLVFIYEKNSSVFRSIFTKLSLPFENCLSQKRFQPPICSHMLLYAYTELHPSRLNILVALLDSPVARRDLTSDSAWDVGGAAARSRGNGGAATAVARQTNKPPPCLQPRDRLVHRAWNLVQNLPANRLNAEYLAFHVFAHLSMNESRGLMNDLKKAEAACRRKLIKSEDDGHAGGTDAGRLGWGCRLGFVYCHWRIQCDVTRCKNK